MVMETPSPQCVGLEFVRQYYTVLNKAPMHLHRFFSHNSSFLHGGHQSMSEPIVGQANIHKMIMSLNFRDCHAKIRMVDAQATMGDGVVIQVTGELSNNGNPMRRFMQTFVLAPQTPKKYYVHNDIFRYQDEVFSDEEGGEEGASEGEEELDPQMTATTFTTSASLTVNGSAHPPEPEPTPPAAPLTPTVASITPTVPVAGVAATTTAPPAVANPPVTAPASSPTPPVTVAPEPTPAATPPTPEKEDQGWGASDSSSWGAPAEPQGSSWEDALLTKEETPDPDPPQPDPVQQPTEPKTYANLFKGSQGGFASAAAPPTAAMAPPSSQPATTPQQPPMSRVEVVSTGRTPPAPSGGLGSGQSSSFTQRPQRSSQGRGPPRDRQYRLNSEDNPDLEYESQEVAMKRNDGNSWVDRYRGDKEGLGEEKRRPQVPDSQQIFVGNLPHSAGEEELKAEFSKFGKIVDIRINTAKGKTGPKGQVPNFGFITFDEESAVNRVLNCRPIHLNGEHRLNVEEKKARMRLDGGMGRPNSGRGGGLGSGNLRQGPPGLQGRGGGRPGFSRDNNRGGPRGGYVSRR